MINGPDSLCSGRFCFEIQFTNAIMIRIIGDRMIDADLS